MRQNKAKGQYVRRTEWIEKVEISTNLFCKLETQDFVNKTINKLVIDENTVTVAENQKEI